MTGQLVEISDSPQSKRVPGILTPIPPRWMTSRAICCLHPPYEGVAPAEVVELRETHIWWVIVARARRVQVEEAGEDSGSSISRRSKNGKLPAKPRSR